jgi:hypothetical protein
VLLLKGSERKSTCISKIPIYDISNVSTGTASLGINTNKETVINWCEGNKNDYVGRYFSMGFSYDAETDLEQRFNRAFLHLKKFYKKPISTETF